MRQCSIDPLYIPIPLLITIPFRPPSLTRCFLPFQRLNWALQIRGVSPEDAGRYECQATTHPPQNIVVKFRVVGKKRTHAWYFNVCGPSQPPFRPTRSSPFVFQPQLISDNLFHAPLPFPACPRPPRPIAWRALETRKRLETGDGRRVRPPRAHTLSLAVEKRK